MYLLIMGSFVLVLVAAALLSLQDAARYRTCPHCRERISRDAAICPHCRSKF